METKKSFNKLLKLVKPGTSAPVKPPQQIPGLSLYRITRAGDVIYLKTGRPVRVRKLKDKYRVSLMTDEGVRKTFDLFTLMTRAYIVKADESQVAVPIDGNRKNLSINNLSWESRSLVYRRAHANNRKKTECGKLMNALEKGNLLFTDDYTGKNLMLFMVKNGEKRIPAVRGPLSASFNVNDLVADVLRKPHIWKIGGKVDNEVIG